MENKTIIIILLIIIVILAAAIGVVLLNPATAKVPTKVKITSDDEQYENNETLTVKLTDLDKNQISKEVVNITITDSKDNIVVDNVVKTNSKGNGILDLNLKKGEYDVYVAYGGNENYTGNDTSQKLTINEEEVVEEAEPVSSSEPSTPSAYAYKSDGTPMYSQAEVDSYMHNKYGLVNYHVGSNGYIDMDEPGFDDAGHWIGY